MTRASDTAKLLGAGATINDGTTITTDDNTNTLSLISTDADASTGPNLVLQRDSASPADNDLSGTIKFIADNDAAEATDCVSIFSKIIDASNGSEDASLLINSIVGGSQISRFNITPTEIAINDDSIDLDFRVESNGNANMLFVDGENDRVGIGTNSPARELQVDSAGNRVISVHHTDGDYAFVVFQDNNTSDDGQVRVGALGDACQLWAGGSERVRVHSDGNISIGKSAANNTDVGIAIFGASGAISIVRDGGQTLILDRLNSDGQLVSLRQGGVEEGTITVSGNTVSYNAFSGSHWSRLTDNSKPTILKGTVIETIDEMCDWYQAKFTIPATTIKDDEGKDVENTPEVTKKISIALPDGKSVGDTISYTHEGVTYDDAVIIKEDDNKHTKCKISDTADSKRVYGVFADFDNDDDSINDMYVTAVGTHVVRINKDVTVSAGDLLSSNGDGTAKVQDDDIIRSKTIGKVLTNIKQETYSDGSYTVPCALYCG